MRPPIQHMQNALMKMNLQLHHVVADIAGARGMKIIRAIIAGERRPEVLAAYRDVRCHASIETIQAALTGNDHEKHIFALRQSLEIFETYQMNTECDAALETSMAAIVGEAKGPAKSLGKAQGRTSRSTLRLLTFAPLFTACWASTCPNPWAAPFEAVRSGWRVK